jgi:O-antigen ligase/tetratricopeptide (TPR) repeat protein
MSNQHGNLTTSRHAHAQATGAGALSALMLNIIDGGLAGVIFLVPFVMGGRHPLGQLILAALAVVTGLAWAIRQSLHSDPVWRPTWFLALISAGVILIMLQIMPLPQDVLQLLAPSQAKILPLWNAAAQPNSASLGYWETISFAPEETRENLVLALSYGLLFFVTVQRIKAIEDVERLLRWCALSATCMAVFGLVQYLASNGEFFWFYTHPFSNTFDAVKGSFANKNHFAHFLALGVGPLIWWLLHASRRMRSRIDGADSMSASALDMPKTARRHSSSRDRAPMGALHGKIGWSGSTGANRSNELKTYILGLALAVVLFAGMMSLSSGGMAALFIAALVSAAVCFLASSATGRFLGIMLAACLVIGAALAIFGLDNVGRRLETLTHGATEQDEWSGGRITLWTHVAAAIPDYFWLGAGAGSFSQVYPIYSDGALNESIEFTHAENSYLQDLLETGCIGLGLTLACIVSWGSWCAAGWKGSERIKICAGAIAGTLAAGTAQALVDFVWYVPACMAIMAILAACALRVSQFASPRAMQVKPAPMHRWAAVIAAIALIAVGAWMIDNRIGPAIAQPYWEQYLIALVANSPQQPTADNADSTSRHNADDAAPARENKLIDCLENIIYWQPNHSSAHLALAEAHLRLFEVLQANSPNPMTLTNIRDAALDSEFSSPQALHDWLARALGDHWVHLDAALLHTRAALSLCPLQGRGYIHLAKTCFLDGKKGLPKQACIAQALRVRPFDGAVVSAAASEALLEGDMQHWLELSKQAFRCGRGYQRELICNLVANVPSEGIQAMIDFIITQFQPDLENLQALYAACSKRIGSEPLVPLCKYLAQRAEFEAQNRKGQGVIGLWLEAQRLHTQLNNGPQALQCARRALECDRNNYRAHYQLASCLLDQGLFAEAEEHLHWCLQRAPGDQSVEIKLKQAIKGRLDAQRCAAAQKNDKF